MSAVNLNVLHHEEHLSYYPEATIKIVVFEKYRGISAKDHDRIRLASRVIHDYDIFIAIHLP